MENKLIVENIRNLPEGVKSDANAPYSFLDWKSRRPIWDEKELKTLYANYLLEWFDNNALKANAATLLLKQKYLLLLKQLQLFFTEEEKNNWYNKINIANEKELLLSIPYFAKKLKEVAVYYLKLRKKIKKTPRVLGTKGAVTGLEQQIYTRLLEFVEDNTEKNYHTIQSTLPSIEDIRNSLVVEIEELYDDKVYYDRSTGVPASAYFDFLDEATASFLSTKGVTLSSAEWLFNSLQLSATNDIDKAIADFTGNYFESTEYSTYGAFVQNFLAENKYTLTSSPLISTTEVFDIEIASGGNNFYYPYGITENTSGLKQVIQPVALSSLTIENATAGADLKTADSVFVRVGNETKAAWLRLVQFKEYEAQMGAYLEQDKKTNFIFPYAGYGVANPDLVWSGAQFNTTKEYRFLSKQYKEQVDNYYWDTNYSANSCENILLNNTQLASTGATSNKNPNLADQIFLKPAGSNRSDYNSREAEGAWLYRFDKTSLPITANTKNVIFWPYKIIDTEETFPPHFQELKMSDVCDPLDIQDLNVPYAIASDQFSCADKIYKLEKYSDSIEDASECFWLSGKNTRHGRHEYIEANAFNAVFAPGKFVKFVWNGPDTPVNKAFTAIPHSKDCLFSQQKATVGEPEKCSCKQVYYSPFGHPGNSFDTHNGWADCILTDNDQGKDISFSSWRSQTGASLHNKKERFDDFAWYQTKNKTGWGDGRWVTGPSNTGAEFILRKGQTYFFRRSNSGIYDTEFPPYVSFFKHKTTKAKAVWANAIKQGQEWFPTDSVAVFQLKPGDILQYERVEESTFRSISSVSYATTPSASGINAWTYWDTVPVGYNITFFWPNTIIEFDKKDPQYPSMGYGSVSAVQFWTITLLNNANHPDVEKVHGNKPTLTFTPTVTGTYKIELTALMRDGRVLVFDNIPLLTVVPKISFKEVITEETVPSSSFLIEQKLTGWSYAFNKRYPTDPGAKPFWAKLQVNKDEATKYKAIESWGYNNSVYSDGYLPTGEVPEVSPLSIAFSNIISYQRRGNSITWSEPIQYKESINSTQWCELSYIIEENSNLSEVFDTKDRPNLLGLALETPSTIILGSDVKGATPEITYWAQNDFLWSISAVSISPNQDTSGTPKLFYENNEPWKNIGNRFYPTIASIPVLEQTFTKKDVGGYFLPKDLGATQLINKNFTPFLKHTEENQNELVEDTNAHIGGLGLSKQYHSSRYNWRENNEWTMEPSTAGKLAGAPKKSLTKELQTFIPYQSNTEETPLGILTTKSKYTPWGGPFGNEWKDTANEPKSYTGIRNLSAWSDSQELKQSTKPLDCWVDDIYGNQYGLFKEVDGLKPSLRREANGELWVRTNSQKVMPAYEALATVFEPFQGTSVFEELTSGGIKHVDCFYDTLLLETSGAVILANVNYNFDNQQIVSTFDNTKVVLLTAGKFKYENNWFFPKPKILVSAFTLLTAKAFVPKLWVVDTKNKTASFNFPNASDERMIITSLTGLSAGVMNRGVMSYNDLLKTYLLTYTGKTELGKLFAVNFKIKQTDELSLQELSIFTDTKLEGEITEPPTIFSQYLSAIPIQVGYPFTLGVSGTNEPTSYQLLNYTNSVQVLSSGIFTGILSAGLHHVNYTVSNKIGSTSYSLTLSSV